MQVKCSVPERDERLWQLPAEGLQKLGHHVDVVQGQALDFAGNFLRGVPANLNQTISNENDKTKTKNQQLRTAIYSLFRYLKYIKPKRMRSVGWLHQSRSVKCFHTPSPELLSYRRVTAAQAPPTSDYY